MLWRKGWVRWRPGQAGVDRRATRAVLAAPVNSASSPILQDLRALSLCGTKGAEPPFPTSGHLEPWMLEERFRCSALGGNQCGRQMAPVEAQWGEGVCRGVLRVALCPPPVGPHVLFQAFWGTRGGKSVVVTVFLPQSLVGERSSGISALANARPHPTHRQWAVSTWMPAVLPRSSPAHCSHLPPLQARGGWDLLMAAEIRQGSVSVGDTIACSLGKRLESQLPVTQRVRAIGVVTVPQ